MNAQDRHRYWQENKKYVSILLLIWAFVSFGLSIVFVDHLDRITIGSFKLGFWMAQQGSIFSFVAIIFAYMFLMNRLDRKYNLDK